MLGDSFPFFVEETDIFVFGHAHVAEGEEVVAVVFKASFDAGGVGVEDF